MKRTAKQIKAGLANWKKMIANKRTKAARMRNLKVMQAANKARLAAKKASDRRAK